MATLSDIGVAAAINILTAFAFFIAFAILRLQPVNDRVYFPKWYLKGLRSSPIKTGGLASKFVNLDFRSYIKFLNWMPQALRMPEPELIDHAGLDSVVYLRIYLLGLKIFFPIACLAFLVMVPVNWTNTTLDKLQNLTFSDIDKLSISNIPNGSSRFWVHLCMAYVISFWTCFVLKREYKIIGSMRLQFLASDQRRPDQFTVLVRNIPPDPDESVWLLTLVVLPARANIVVRLGLVVCTALLSISVLPRQVWMDQLARVSLLSGILFITLGLGSDGAPPMLQSRTPPSSLTGLPDLPMSLTGYSYMLLKLGPLQFTRKGLSVGSTAACLTFIFQSASICLATTTPEQLALAMRWFLFPLTYIGVPVGEIILTLLLSLRFINLVFDEVRSVALGIVSRRVDWKQLTVLETLDIFASFIRRIFKNIFRHAEQISQAMIVRGFRGESSSHKIYFFSGSSNKFADFASVLGLIGVISTALLSEYFFV
ncbi:hypothetical protein F2Q70_00010263 [Brassica cretica]|uniref:CSC1/OSCA1-like N-terminal transmembrane domain-containing protein n=1 Tax=Brassica cretica TaxID=69181 RepID=A0A8S9LZI2_BRACR|nr:hypothetical protein F2Q70_00010263 [Brassica cretica]